MTYDLHIHSCLSPCANDDMTPAAIAGFAKLNGIDVIAVADHNSALNLPALSVACKEYGVNFVPAIEVNTEEEIHLLTYFKTVDAALEMGEILYKSLPTHKYDKNLWGRQLVLNEDDVLICEPEKLLTGAVSLGLYEVCKLCSSLCGVAVPAHVDKDSFSLLSVLGFAPEDLDFLAFEVQRPEHSLKNLLATQRLPENCFTLTSSDAHQLCDIAQHPRALAQTNPFYAFVNNVVAD